MTRCRGSEAQTGKCTGATTEMLLALAASRPVLTGKTNSNMPHLRQTDVYITYVPRLQWHRFLNTKHNPSKQMGMNTCVHVCARKENSEMVAELTPTRHNRLDAQTGNIMRQLAPHHNQ